MDLGGYHLYNFVSIPRRGFHLFRLLVARSETAILKRLNPPKGILFRLLMLEANTPRVVIASASNLQGQFVYITKQPNSDFQPHFRIRAHKVGTTEPGYDEAV